MKIGLRRIAKFSVVFFLELKNYFFFFSQKLVRTQYECLEFATTAHFETNSTFKTRDMCHGTIEYVVMS